MIDAFYQKPTGLHSSLTPYFDAQQYLGGSTFYSLNINNENITTPAIGWLNNQRSSRYYEIKGLEIYDVPLSVEYLNTYSTNPYVNFYILLRETATDEEHAEFNNSDFTYWEEILDKYIKPDKFIAYRLVVYDDNNRARYMEDVVSNEITGAEKLDTYYEVFERTMTTNS